MTCKQNREQWQSPLGVGWICWDDDLGVDGANPRCDCGRRSRQNRAGKRSSIPDMGFWTCAYGACDYVSFRLDGYTKYEAREFHLPYDDGFYPWLL